jgi:hypothetical protein
MLLLSASNITASWTPSFHGVAFREIDWLQRDAVPKIDEAGGRLRRSGSWRRKF